MEKIDEVLERGVANIIPHKEELKKLLLSGKKLNIYLGIDPTATKIHLGHLVPLRKLQALAELGHNITFLIGDFTALIGDTSDKDNERPVLTEKEIKDNFATYQSQASKILDFSKIKVRFNSQWLKSLNFTEIVKLCQHFSVGDFVGRELIKKRLLGNKRVGLHEFLYPVMQGYDSYFLDTDIQLGGTDQTFNMQAGRTLQKDFRNKESFIITTRFLPGTDGRKMSKSWGNAIWLTDTPEEIYRKVLSIHDELLSEYFILTTDMPLSDLAEVEKRLQKGENPLVIKKELALRLVTEIYDQKSALKAEEIFTKTIQQNELPSEIPTIVTQTQTIIDEEFLTATNLTSSKSEAKRLMQQGGVFLNETKITPSSQTPVRDGDILRVGKKNLVRLKISKL